MDPNLDARRVLVIGADRATVELLNEWLADHGWHVAEAQSESDTDPGPYALFVVDVPFPRRGLSQPLQRLASRHPGTPILALSATFHSSVECTGDVARVLGVAGVLPKPLQRDVLINAVQTLVRSPP
jgi:DNA-binding response OmpR family regulator